jgi:hypothetical protein
MEYLKHPIILGILVSGLCFLYLKIKEHNEMENNSMTETESPSMKYPILLGIIVFLGVSLWQNSKYKSNPTIPEVKIPMDIMSSTPRQINMRMLGDVMPPVFLETH